MSWGIYSKDACTASPPPPRDTKPHPMDELRAADTLSHQFERVYFTEPTRAELVQRVRGEIEAGTYVTNERLAAAVDRLFDGWIRGIEQVARKAAG